MSHCPRLSSATSHPHLPIPLLSLVFHLVASIAIAASRGGKSRTTLAGSSPSSTRSVLCVASVAWDLAASTRCHGGSNSKVLPLHPNHRCGGLDWGSYYCRLGVVARCTRKTLSAQAARCSYWPHLWWSRCSSTNIQDELMRLVLQSSGCITMWLQPAAQSFPPHLVVGASRQGRKQ